MEYSHLVLSRPDAAPPVEFPANDPDVVALLLDDKRSADTRRAYAADLKDFFGGEASTHIVAQFLALPVPQLSLVLANYKSAMRERRLSEATINRRLAAIKSLLKFAHRLGLCQSDGRNLVDGERAKAYRDTRGVDVKTLRKLLAAPSKKYPKPEHALRVARDEAILTLLIENALRRAELCKLEVRDFDGLGKSLWILGKGKGSQKERITLSLNCEECISDYLLKAPHAGGALFRNLDRRPQHFGAPLTPDGLYSLVREYGAFVGVKNLTPHKLRHSAITAALDATKGDVRRVQKLSRHAKIETLLIYDDARVDAQGEVSGMLSKLLR